MIKKDKRVKMISELLRNIKVIKMNAWEESFMQKISTIRKEELSIMRRTAYVNATLKALSYCSPFLVTNHLIQLVFIKIYVICAHELVITYQYPDKIYAF